MTTTKKTHFLHRDLYRIFFLTLFLVVAMGILYYFEQSQGVVSHWATGFYGFLLRI